MVLPLLSCFGCCSPSLGSCFCLCRLFAFSWLFNPLALLFGLLCLLVSCVLCTFYGARNVRSSLLTTMVLTLTLLWCLLSIRTTFFASVFLTMRTLLSMFLTTLPWFLFLWNWTRSLDLTTNCLTRSMVYNMFYICLGLLCFLLYISVLCLY